MDREEKTMGDEDLRLELREAERKVADLVVKLGREGGDGATREELAAAEAKITALRDRLERGE